MPQITKEVTVSAPIEAAWDLVSDMERFSLCIPGCKEVRKVSDEEYDWVMEAKVLHTTRKLTARTRAEVMRPPSHSEFAGEGRLFERSNHYRLTIRGSTDLESVSGGGTRIVFTGDVNASGVAGAIIEKVASGQMDELFESFGRNVRAALGDQGQPPVAAEVSAARLDWRWWLALAAIVAVAAAAVAYLV